ncbi:MAG: nicotinate-nucleotide--dimethylbenzimidazole phosphoribosyltransferase [Eggerthellaceae bacterium]|nr:nicotinate-nucleotide--dimethylbenzimidazole phosphoribosyltransferase [Eggerthellaceae bacterium]
MSQMNIFEELNERIAPLDLDACRRSRDKWNGVAKPIASLGALEDAVVQMAGLIGTQDVAIDKRAVAVMCADNGVVAEGVSQCGSDVTLAVADNIARGESSVCAMARPHNIQAVAIDIGMLYQSADERVWDCNIMRATGNIAQGPAMTREQAQAAIQVGIDAVARLKEQGYGIIAAGEMGIGNTTTSSAMTAVLLDLPAEDVVGRGAGLSDAGLVRKVAVVKQAIEVNQPDASDPLDVLAKVGGLDIAGIAGLFIGGALHRVPVIVDGFISLIAALVAVRLCPRAAAAMLASHTSSEPAVRYVQQAVAEACVASDAGFEQAGVQFRPVIDASMRLGEGTGAVCLVPLLDSTLSIYNGSTFDDIEIEPYEVDLH